MVKKSEEKNEKFAEITDTEMRKEILSKTFSQINKRYGDGAIMKLGDAHRMNVETVSTGSLSIDLALGVGGIPKGRIVEVYGQESSGKTTLCLQMIAQVQKKGGTAAFIDMEHALDPCYAKNLGVDVDNLIIAQPDMGEQALEICDSLVRSCVVDIVVIDSVAALVPRAEIEGDMGDSMMGMQARLMSQALRKLSGSISQSKTILVFTNQIRMKIGMVYGNPETTTGGNALKFYSTVRMEVRKGAPIKDGTIVIGNRTRVKIVKNKVSSPFRVAEFDIIYGKGISYAGEVLDIGAEMGIIEKRGAFYSYNQERIGQGRENAKAYLEFHPEVTEEIAGMVKAKAAESGVNYADEPEDAAEFEDNADFSETAHEEA